MPLDVTKPLNSIKVAEIPPYLRGVWTNHLVPSYTVYTLWWWVSGTLAPGSNLSWEIPVQLDPAKVPSIVSCVARVKTAPTGADLIVDVNKNGTTIYTTQANRPRVPAGTQQGSAAAPDVTGLADGDVLTIDIDQVGSTIAGADLTVAVRIKQNLIIP